MAEIKRNAQNIAKLLANAEYQIYAVRKIKHSGQNHEDNFEMKINNTCEWRRKIRKRSVTSKFSQCPLKRLSINNPKSLSARNPRIIKMWSPCDILFIKR